MSPEEFRARLKEQLRMDNEIDELRAEVERLKKGIKTRDACMIVDNGDMYDHGWTRQEEVAKARFECERLKAELKAVHGMNDLAHAESERLAATLAEREARILEDNAVCLCPCPPGEHESYGEDGEACGNDCECLRVCEGVKQVFDRQRATLSEREARITSLQTELNHEMGKGDLLREELGEREAEIERLKAEKLETAHRWWKLTEERNEARVAVATARAEALEDFIGILFEECQPNNGDLFSRVDDRIRALASDTKGES
jgi:hypothetical protein